MKPLDDNRDFSLECPPAPEVAPPTVDRKSTSFGSMTILEGSPLAVWSDRTLSESQTELKLELAPNQLLVIGRQEGGELHYLDPQYRSTRIMPNTGDTILRHSTYDQCVSRGHFTIKSSPLGLVLVNGVPRRGGGIRPPLNGTKLLDPGCRFLDESEEYLIERKTSAKICLPNGTVILLEAD